MKTVLIIIGVLLIAGAAVYFGTMSDKEPMESPTPTATASVSKTPTPVPGSCRPTGCSGEVCADKEVVTTCAYRPEYICYKTARCERQPGGQCGWTPTSEFQQCLNRF